MMEPQHIKLACRPRSLFHRGAMRAHDEFKGGVGRKRVRQANRQPRHVLFAIDVPTFESIVRLGVYRVDQPFRADVCHQGQTPPMHALGQPYDLGDGQIVSEFQPPASRKPRPGRIVRQVEFDRAGCREPLDVERFTAVGFGEQRILGLSAVAGRKAPRRQRFVDQHRAGPLLPGAVGRPHPRQRCRGTDRQRADRGQA